MSIYDVSAHNIIWINKMDQIKLPQVCSWNPEARKTRKCVIALLSAINSVTVGVRISCLFTVKHAFHIRFIGSHNKRKKPWD